MKNVRALMLIVALISVFLIIWAITIPDVGMIVLLSLNVIVSIYIAFKSKKMGIVQ